MITRLFNAKAKLPVVLLIASLGAGCASFSETSPAPAPAGPLSPDQAACDTTLPKKLTDAFVRGMNETEGNLPKYLVEAYLPGKNTNNPHIAKYSLAEFRRDTERVFFPIGLCSNDSEKAKNALAAAAMAGDAESHDALVEILSTPFIPDKWLDAMAIIESGKMQNISQEGMGEYSCDTKEASEIMRRLAVKHALAVGMGQDVPFEEMGEFLAAELTSCVVSKDPDEYSTVPSVPLREARL